MITNGSDVADSELLQRDALSRGLEEPAIKSGRLNQREDHLHWALKDE